MTIKAIRTENVVFRVGLVAAIFVCLSGVYFSAKWCFANTIAVQAQQQERALPTEIGELAVKMAPSDPQAYYSLGVLYDRSFLPEDQKKSLSAFESATALAPNDFRLWAALGKARERNGDAVGAEKSLRHSLLIAPNYSAVQWSLGNILLRQGKTTEAFFEIRKAALNDSTYLNPAVSALWQTFDGDMAEISQYLGDSKELKTSLSEFLLKEKKYRTAFQVLREIDGVGKFAIGKISNPGFEENEKSDVLKDFQWQIAEGAQPQIGIDSQQKRSGEYSLGFIFNSVDGRDFRNVSQVVVVESGKKYHFETFYKADLKTSATLRWEIVNESDGKVLAATEAVSANADWSGLKAEFTAPEDAEAVIIRIAREPCKTQSCGIIGKIWFDDFSF